MNNDTKFDEAQELIDAFAAKLLALNGGKGIPKEWKKLLREAIAKTIPGKPGKKQNYEKVTHAVKLLALAGDKVRRGRTKHHNPVKFKDEIARAVGISRKNVERIDNDRPQYFKEMQRLDRFAKLDPKLKDAYIKGISAAIVEKLEARDKTKAKAREDEARKIRLRFPQLIPPEK